MIPIDGETLNDGAKVTEYPPAPVPLTKSLPPITLSGISTSILKVCKTGLAPVSVEVSTALNLNPLAL